MKIQRAKDNNNSEDDAVTFKKERKISLQMWLGGTVIPIIPQSLKTSAKEYAESDSDLGDDEERILMHAR